jgi:CRISPR-associated protein Cas1
MASGDEGGFFNPCAWGLEGLAWHSLALPLSPRLPLGHSSPALIVLNALLKSIKPPPENTPPYKIAFHLPGEAAHRFRRRPGQAFTLELRFFGADAGAVQSWLDCCAAYLSRAPKANFALAGVPQITAHSGAEWLIAGDAQAQSAELEFLSPLPFKREAQAGREHLGLAAFLSQLQQRLKTLCGLDLPAPASVGVELQSHYWEYCELRHDSKSQPGHQQYYNGCVGPLYFSGELGPLMPWLRLAATMHGGGPVQLNGLGHCRLHLPARPFFDSRLQQPQAWRKALEKVQASHDDWAVEMAQEQGAPVDAQAYCAELSAMIGQADWRPAPALAFSVNKRDGQRRLEKLPLAELVVHTAVQELLAPYLDRLLENAAFGFRRGRSAQAAAGQAQALLAEGYRHVIQADIEDFFPTVQLPRLQSLLERALPPGDAATRLLLRKLLHAPYLEGGQARSRSQGLAQGSPLSPMLANLYLDRFDEAFGGQDAKLIRYADDFIILTHTRAQAESLQKPALYHLFKSPHPRAGGKPAAAGGARIGGGRAGLAGGENRDTRRG